MGKNCYSPIEIVCVTHRNILGMGVWMGAMKSLGGTLHPFCLVLIKPSHKPGNYLGLFSICVWSQPMRDEVTYAMSSLIGWGHSHITWDKRWKMDSGLKKNFCEMINKTNASFYHDMEKFSTLLLACEENLLVTDFPHKRPVMWIFIFLSAWTSFWPNSQVTGDSKCHDVHVTSL